MKTALFRQGAHFALLHLDIACLDDRVGACVMQLLIFVWKKTSDSADLFVQEY